MSDPKSQVYLRLLILRCQGGDEAALAELIGRYSIGLRMFLGKIAPQAADDLMQETWFDVYRKINRLRDPDQFTAWLYRIARDKAYRLMRRWSPPREEAEPVAEVQEDFSAEDAEEVRAALDRLPLEHREILILRFVQEMDYGQIAVVIDRPVGTVRSRLHYAKRALREHLELQQKELKP